MKVVAGTCNHRYRHSLTVAICRATAPVTLYSAWKSNFATRSMGDSGIFRSFARDRAYYRISRCENSDRGALVRDSRSESTSQPHPCSTFTLPSGSIITVCPTDFRVQHPEPGSIYVGKPVRQDKKPATTSRAFCNLN